MSTLFAQRRRLVCACYAKFFCFDFSMTLHSVESYSVCFCIILHNLKVLKRIYISLIFILSEGLWQLIYPNSCIRLIICVISLLMTSHKYMRRQCNVWHLNEKGGNIERFFSISSNAIR